MVLASAATLDAATEREAARWKLGETAELRGRARPTHLACPAYG